MWATPVRCAATVVALRGTALERGACFEALYQKQNMNKLKKQQTKQAGQMNSTRRTESSNLNGLCNKT
eukprot:6204421-Pleurochrysis_carterae.AAC.4